MFNRGGDKGGFDRGPPRRSFAPVKVGDELTVKIEAVGEKGDGIAKKDGFVLFVPGTKQGDEVKVRITRVLRRVGFAEVAGAGSSSRAHQEAGAEDAGEESETFDDEAGDAASEDETAGEDSEDFGDEEKS